MAKRMKMSEVLANLDMSSDSENDELDYPSSEFDSDTEISTDGDQNGEVSYQEDVEIPTRQATPLDQTDFTWSQNVNKPDISFESDLCGPRNMPNSFNAVTSALEFFTVDFIQNLCKFTNLRAAQVKRTKERDYYASSWVDIKEDEMKAFIGMRLTIEFSLTKPKYEDYFANEATNFLTYTPGFRDVFSRDRFLDIWKFLHVVDEENPSLDKTDKIYKVRPVLTDFLDKFKHFWNPKQFLSLDEGMIPAKNRLSIKQYIRIKPIKWGIKSFLLCESDTGYLMNAEIYTGKSNGFVSQDLGSTGSVVVRLCSDLKLEHTNFIVVMDRYYTSIKLFHYMFKEKGIHALGTTMINRKFFPDDLKKTNAEKKRMNRGDYDYRCTDNLVAVSWKDREPVSFISTFGYPTQVQMINRRAKDGTLLPVNCPDLVTMYNKYMGGTDKNDQITRLNRTRRNYRWTRRLMIKFMFWAIYNAFVIYNNFVQRTLTGRKKTVGHYLNEISLGLVGEFRTESVLRRRRSVNNNPEPRLQTVGGHPPERATGATGNNVCKVCGEIYNRYIRSHPNQPRVNMPVKQTRTVYRCKACKVFLCLREGSNCWDAWHNLKEFWRQ